ncbi:MAG TPA: acyl-CoA dehydrogenase family protein [Egibacteraceae bacterium]|nr:acyl-CoA dehydrogenase family protein [Egibacteraceae bacterium]
MSTGSTIEAAQRCASRFAERASIHDEQASFPTDDVADLRDAGLLGLLVPERLGGAGAGFAEYVEVAMTLAAGSGATALVFNMHACVTGALAGVPDDLARQLGAPEWFFDARDEMLARAARGALYGVAITERGAGSRLSKMTSTFRREGDGYRISGHKSVATGAGHVDAYLVAARAADADDEDPRVSYFLVPHGDGVTVVQTWDPLGMRATASNSVRLDALVPATALIGGIEGLAVLLAYAMPQWLVASYAAVYVGVAQALLDEAVRYVTARSVAGQPGGLGGVGFVRARLGRADAAVAAARLAIREAARCVDLAPGEPETNRAIYRGKLLAGDAVSEVAHSCTEACGLGALGKGSTMERLYRDARSGAIMPPSSDVCADVLGTAALGLDPVTGSEVRPW